MKLHALALVAATAGFLVAAGACAWLLTTYMAGYGPGMLFLEADILLKLAMMICILLWLPITGLGVAGLSGRSRGIGGLLAAAGWSSALLGLLAGAYGLLMIRMTLNAVGPVRFAVTAPAYAEAALAAAVGLAGAMAAFAFGAAAARFRALRP
ncbi:MAG: hypothetical protein A2623_13500 [Caulobacterales bacterium RIFCSPHIGHO2_01_FULL_70_19]|nr:MAG: hypothetical protein A2623_13500 [Caulobacterales bacterium RIFCSPHIGHO2_01_FULL_70_19]